MNPCRTDGVVLVAVLLLTLLMGALGAALVLVTSSEAAVASNFRDAREARYGAEMAAERALVDLAAIDNWNQLLDGTTRSAIADGPPHGTRTIAGGSIVDLDAVQNLANCRKMDPCTAAEMEALSADRPWGPNNPRWRLFAYGWLRNVLQSGASDSPYYLIVLVADDPSETDGDPTRDALPPSPGTGVVMLRAQVFGPHGAHRGVEVTVARTSSGDSRPISWREAR